MKFNTNHIFVILNENVNFTLTKLYNIKSWLIKQITLNTWSICVLIDVHNVKSSCPMPSFPLGDPGISEQGWGKILGVKKLFWWPFTHTLGLCSYGRKLNTYFTHCILTLEAISVLCSQTIIQKQSQTFWIGEVAPTAPSWIRLWFHDCLY